MGGMAAASIGHTAGPAQEFGQIEANQSRRHQAKMGQSRVTAANLRISQKDPAKALFLGQFF